MRHADSPCGPEVDAGFTLVEVLVASLLFAIGMIGAVAMQYTALGGFANSRDVSRAADVGERVIHILKQESQQWQTANEITTMSRGVYNDKSSGPGYFASGSLLKTLAAGGDYNWHPVFENPVDVRLSDAGARRYCAYFRGEEIPNPTGASGASTGSGIYRIQIAVVYPGPNRVFPGGGEVGECASDRITDNLEPKRWDDTTISDLESEGYRAVFMGTQIILRNFLREGGRFGS